MPSVKQNKTTALIKEKVIKITFPNNLIPMLGTIVSKPFD